MVEETRQHAQTRSRRGAHYKDMKIAKDLRAERVLSSFVLLVRFVVGLSIPRLRLSVQQGV